MNMMNIAALAAAILLFILFLSGCDSEISGSDPESMKTITINSIKIDAEIADSPEEMEKGLMYRKSLGSDSGMLFVFPDENYRRFWMKNTLIPLDILFIAGNGTIVDIKGDFQPCKLDPCKGYQSKEKASYVLEVNAGFAEENKINIGDSVLIN